MKNEEERLKLFVKESNAIEGIYNNPFLENCYFDVCKEVYSFFKDQKELKAEHIIKWHEKLNLGVKYLRNVNVRVGNYIAPHYSLVVLLLCELVKTANAIKKEQDCWDIHHAFEMIHPFEDGNGRIGRLLLNWCRMKLGLGWLIIYEKDRAQYYEEIRKFSESAINFWGK